MKKIICLCFALLLFNIYTVDSYATDRYSKYYQKFLDAYEGKNSDLDKLSLSLDKALAQYLELVYTINDTDHWIFINGDCLIGPDISVSIGLDSKLVDEKIYYINSISDQFNIQDDWVDMNLLYNEWYFSLGANYIKYIKVINDVNRAIYRANREINKYNAKYNDEDPADYIRYLDQPYTKYSYKEVKEEYFNKCLLNHLSYREIMDNKEYSNMYDYPVYPQG